MEPHPTLRLAALLLLLAGCSEAVAVEKEVDAGAGGGGGTGGGAPLACTGVEHWAPLGTIPGMPKGAFLEHSAWSNDRLFAWGQDGDAVLGGVYNISQQKLRRARKRDRCQ